MNTIKRRWYRLWAVPMLAAAGILTVIVSGCGGGGGGGNGDDGTGDTGPTLAITVDNGEAVSTTVLTGMMAMFEVTEGAGGPILEPTAGGVSVLRKVGRMPGTVFQVPVEGTESCDVTGTVSLSGNLADPTTLTEGDTITAVFDNCDDGDGFVIDGRIAMTVAAVDGSVFGDVFLLTLDMVMSDLTVTSEGESVSADGDLAYTLDALDFPEVAMLLAGEELSVVEAGRSVTFRNFDQTLEVNPGIVPTSYVAAANGRLRSSQLGGSVDYETVVRIRASGDDNPPNAGEMLVTGADDSEVRIVVVSEETVRLEIDEEGDGVVDAFIDTTWAALIGEATS
jgi:hypothetical protein